MQSSVMFVLQDGGCNMDVQRREYDISSLVPRLFPSFCCMQYNVSTMGLYRQYENFVVGIIYL